MVRMFKPQFAPLVEAGTKRQTVRPTPKRMPFVGQHLSLRTWTGRPYRSKQRVLATARVMDVQPIRITDETLGIRITPPVGMHYWPDPDTFARADGFKDWPELREWFRTTHGLPFTGILIEW